MPDALPAVQLAYRFDRHASNRMAQAYERLAPLRQRSLRCASRVELKIGKTAAIYARVSSDRQREREAIASQTGVVLEHTHQRKNAVPPEWVFERDGFSGARLRAR